MVNRNVFGSSTSRAPAADTVNKAGGTAYSFSAKHQLAQLAATGTLHNTYYADGSDQLADVLKLVQEVPAEFVAKVALYARRAGYMKDMPALLTAYLGVEPVNQKYMDTIFPQIIGNGKMLRNFVQVIRSGQLGRKSLGTHLKRMVNIWLANRTPQQLLNDSVGNSPSVKDIIKMTHPRPSNQIQSALYGYILGKKYDHEQLPGIIKEFEAWKLNPVRETPHVEFRLLTGIPLPDETWRSIARNAPWTMTRMNLMTFKRHNVFTDEGTTDLIARRLADPGLVRGARVFPYQIMTAIHMLRENNQDNGIPSKVIDALEDAMEIAIENVPEFQGNVVVAPDTSGSMIHPVTGSRGSASTSVSCRVVAKLFSAIIRKRADNCRIMPFDTKVHQVSQPSRRDTASSIVTMLESYRQGGGTEISLPLRQLNAENAKVDLMIYVSDNESWLDSRENNYRRSSVTATQEEWRRLKARCPNAKMICIDLTPNGTTQAKSSNDILNVGGFSDKVFDVISRFIESNGDPEFWVKTIDAVNLKDTRYEA